MDHASVLEEDVTSCSPNARMKQARRIDSSEASAAISCHKQGSFLSDLMSDEMRITLEAMEVLPLADKIDFMTALETIPHVVAKETNPSIFLRVERGCAVGAAKRLAKHWSTRKGLFGERALRPILDLTKEGALDEEDKNLLKSGFYMPLLTDCKGRSMFVFDMSRISTTLSTFKQTRPRVAFYLMTKVAAENPLCQTEGLRIVRILRFSWFDRGIFHREMDVLNSAMALKLYDFHFIGMPPPGARHHFLRTVLPLAQSVLLGEAKVLMGSNLDKLMSVLLQSDFAKNGLPMTVGGTWSYDNFDMWFAEQVRKQDFKPAAVNIIQMDDKTEPAKKKRKLRRQELEVAIPREAIIVHSVAQKNKRKVDHTYRDYSRVPPHADSHAGEHNDIRHLTFVEKLYHLLSQTSMQGYIYWLPHGRAFKLGDRDRLEESRILEKYFGINRVADFILKLRSLGFKQLTVSADRGGFYHECLLRGLPHLTKYMPAPRDVRAVLPDPENEPSLASISKQYPLPDLDTFCFCDMVFPTMDQTQFPPQQSCSSISCVNCSKWKFLSLFR